MNPARREPFQGLRSFEHESDRRRTREIRDVLDQSAAVVGNTAALSVRWLMITRGRLTRPGHIAQIAADHPEDEPRIVCVACRESPGFRQKAEAPFHAALLHPSRGELAECDLQQNQASANLDTNGDAEIHIVPINPTFALRLPKTHKQNVGLSHLDTCDQRGMFFRTQFTKRRASVPTI